MLCDATANDNVSSLNRQAVSPENLNPKPKTETETLNLNPKPQTLDPKMKPKSSNSTQLHPKP